MDTIKISEYQSKYSKGSYPMIYVNGESLDTILDREYPGENLYGLVPAVTWLWDDSEQEISIDRFLNQTEASTFVPLLVCPDDADFTCTILIVEVENVGSEVFWRRIGIDAGDTKNGVGITVKWLAPQIEFRFPRDEYDKFRQELVAIAKCA